MNDCSGAPSLDRRLIVPNGYWLGISVLLVLSCDRPLFWVSGPRMRVMLVNKPTQARPKGEVASGLEA